MSLRPKAAVPPSYDVVTMRRALEAAAVEARRWDAVHTLAAPSPLGQMSGAPESIGAGNAPNTAISDIVGLLGANLETMITLRGLLQHLHLCQVNKRYNRVFSCRDRSVWKTLLKYAEDTTTVPNDAKLMSTTAEVDALVKTLDDDRAAQAYKRAFIDHVIFRALVGYEAYKYKEDYLKDTWFNLIWFNEQVDIFLARSNGSIPKVVKKIKEATADLRKKDPSYPPIPADFFVGAIKMIKTVNGAENTRHRGAKGGGGSYSGIDQSHQQTELLLVNSVWG